MEKQTIICDVCDERVAKCKCEICGKDVCSTCLGDVSIGFTNLDTRLLNIDTCEKCGKQLGRVCIYEPKIFQEVMNEKPELKNEIAEIIKNIIMLKKISDEDIEKDYEKINENLFKTPTPYPIPRKPFKTPKKWYIQKSK